MFFWKKKKFTPEDERLAAIIKLLFPPLGVARTPSGKKYHIDYAVDSNLDAVLLDLQEGNNDAACQKTLESCIKRLNETRRILEAYAEFDSEAEYLIVDSQVEDDETESIQIQK